MDLYPINLNIKEKKILIVGAGKVAFRKFERLLAAGAAIKVVSPNFNDQFSLYLNKKSEQYELIKRKFKTKDLNSSFLVFAATDNSELNHKIALLAKEKNILINIVDNAEFSDFTLPAVINRGDLLLTVASGCNLPALSKKIRKELESEFGLEYQLLLEVMSKKRAYIISNIENNELRKEIFNKIAADNFLNKVKIIF
jgi:precorrin-2 dehydrogenase/sirohydrochlorin ferrochelatase